MSALGQSRVQWIAGDISSRWSNAGITTRMILFEFDGAKRNGGRVYCVVDTMFALEARNRAIGKFGENPDRVSDSFIGHSPLVFDQNGVSQLLVPLTRSSEYSSWVAMRFRCNSLMPDYGGRGITVCAEWQNSFHRFFHDMGRKPTSKHSLERIDVNGNYCKENCKWATWIEQRHNQRRHIKYLTRLKQSRKL